MIWGEQQIRDRVRTATVTSHFISTSGSLNMYEAEALLNEIDLLREVLRQVRQKATTDVVRKIAEEALK